MLNLGMFKETAKITLNDSLLGYAWHPGYSFVVQGILKEGANILKADVANVYRNRIIGDLRQYGTLKSVWTTSPVDELLNRNMPLKESGLIGPITLKKIHPMEIILE